MRLYYGQRANVFYSDSWRLDIKQGQNPSWLLELNGVLDGDPNASVRIDHLYGDFEGRTSAVIVYDRDGVTVTPLKVNGDVVVIYSHTALELSINEVVLDAGAGFRPSYLVAYFHAPDSTNPEISYLDAIGDGIQFEEEGEPTETPTPEPKEYPPTQIDVPDAFGWVGDVLKGLQNLAAWIVDKVATPISGIGSSIGLLYTRLGGSIDEQTSVQRAINSSLSGVGDKVAEGISQRTADIIKKATAEALANMQTATQGATAHSPEWKTQIEATLNPYADEIVSAIQAEVNPALYSHSPISPEEAKDALTQIAGGIIAVEVGLFIANAALEGATLGQVECIKEFETMVISKLGLNQIGQAAFTMPVNELVIKKAQQFYAAEYTPEIPNYSDLINMRVKEKISQEDFIKNFAYLGFEKRWADLIWDAHFIPPTLNDFLTAWRRGLITEAQLDQFMIRVDLDPEFKEVFDTRKYQDPPLNMIRFMFETGSIDKATVGQYVHRLGYAPAFESNIVDYITEFQARLWRRRYLVSLSQGYEKGLYTVDQLRQAVTEAEYTPEVADYIVKNADVRKNIAGSKITTEKVKLFSVSDLKKLFMQGFIDQDRLRAELMSQGYSLSDADLLISMLVKDKQVEEAGGPTISLTQAQLMDAFRYSQLTEDQVKTELMIRGMSQDEVNILIETVKLKWGVGT